MAKNLNKAENRASASFGELLAWHFRRGTRPAGSPGIIGDVWTPRSFAELIKKEDRTVRYWIATGRARRIVPSYEDYNLIERALFGTNPAYEEYRVELRDAHHRSKSVLPKLKAEPDNAVSTTTLSHDAEHHVSASTAQSSETSALSGEIPREINFQILVPRYFRGREEALKEIGLALTPQQSHPPVAALHGMPGVGKTALVHAYVAEFASEYHAIWQIDARTVQGMRAGLVALGVRLRWVKAEENVETAFEAVVSRLSFHGDGILLIYENASDPKQLRPYLPSRGVARILITSNSHSWRSVAVPIKVSEWPKTVGGNFLIARSGQESNIADAEALSEALGGLPLAHEQAAAYCESLCISLNEYHKRFLTQPIKYLEEEQYAPVEYGLTVAKTVSLAIEAAEARHPAAEQLIVHFAMFALEPIPIFLLSEADKEEIGDLALIIQDENLERCLSTLRSFSLIELGQVIDEIDTSSSIRVVTLHRLVHLIARTRRDISAQREIFVHLSRMMLNSFRVHRIHYIPDWPRWRRLVPLAIPLVEFEEDVLEYSRGTTIKLLSCVANYYFQIVWSAKKARPFSEEALRRCIKYAGKRHNYTLEAINELGSIYKMLGRYDEAEALLRDGLGVSRSFKGNRHFLTAHLLSSLATTLTFKGKQDEARDLFEEAVPLFEKIYGDDSPPTIMLTGAYALTLFDLGEWLDAFEEAEWSIEALEDRLGADDPQAIAHRQSLERIIFSDRDPVIRRKRYDEQLKRQVAIFGEKHPDSINTLILIGEIERSQGEKSRATEIYKTALCHAKAVYDPQDGIIARLEKIITDLA